MFFGVNRSKIEQKPILVVSRDRANLISENLSVRGIPTKCLNKGLLELKPSDLGSNIEALVVDVGLISNTADALEILSKILPRGLPSVIIADNDSIKIRQEFLARGLKYLHFDTQLGELYSEINSTEVAANNARAINIKILGTKGGVGTSFIAFGVASAIFNRYKTRTLLIQNESGSFNIDLFSNKNFLNEYFSENELCLLRPNKEQIYDPNKYNFIIDDESVGGADKETLEALLNEADCVVIVINHELASIKKAKEIIEANEFLLSAGQGSKNLILALNDISRAKTLGSEEVKEVLKIKQILEIPFNKGAKEVGLKFSGKSKKAIDELTSIILGEQKRAKLAGIFSL